MILDIRRKGPRRCRLSVKEARGRGPAVTRDVSEAQDAGEAAELLTELCGAWHSDDRKIIRAKTLALFAQAEWPLGKEWFDQRVGQQRL